MQCIRHMTNAYYDNIIKKIFLRYDKRGFEKLEGNRIKKLQDGLYPNIHSYIINRFNDSPNNVTLRENLTRIIYHIEKRPVCKLCGKEVSFNGKKKLNFFDNYCSCRCAGIDTYNYNSLLGQQEYNLKHYGVKHNFQTKKFKEKRKQSLIEHFGSLNDFQKYTENKGKETLKEHYGSLENAYNVSYERSKKTCLEKYGKENYTKTEEYRIKAYNTRKKNHTFNSSKPEEKGYKFLYNKFGFCDVKRQYKTKEYPFYCDFYIKSLDTYIEFNFFWMHGKHKFDPNNKDDINKLNNWKNSYDNGKNPIYYFAIDTWTNRDINKFECAEKNNLNYLAFYTWNEFLEWYNNI